MHWTKSSRLSCLFPLSSSLIHSLLLSYSILYPCLLVQLILVLGDFHIPHRSENIPDAFKSLLQQKVSQVLCTGNLCMKSTEDFVRSLGYNAHIVKGDLDAGLELPESKVIKVGELVIGLIHGHQIVPWGDSAMLANHARSMGVDILVHGHTHALEVLRSEGSSTSSKSASVAAASPTAASPSAAGAATSFGSTLLLNPGSITGAYSPFTTSVSPSFCLLAIQGPNVTVYQYELLAAGAEVTVTKTEWSKTK